MISLKELIRKTYPDHPALLTIPDIPIQGLECDSRKVEKDFLFVAIRGVKADGNDFIGEAVGRGAAAVVADSRPDWNKKIPLIVLPECRSAMARLAAAFYGDPARQMRMIGITGTNGKTTSSYLIEHFLEKEKKKAGVIGTVNYRFGGEEIDAAETTPGPLRLQQLLWRMKNAGCEYAVMEVSSHALDQQRVSGIGFETAVFTNLTQDHLDYHGTMQSYFDCKARLFLGLPDKKSAVLNEDDEWVRKLRGRLKCGVIGYGVSGSADLNAQNLMLGADRTEFDLVINRERSRVRSPLVGLHNVYNVLGALGVMQALDFDAGASAAHLASFRGVPGRLETVDCRQVFKVFIDFAHTPDGLENVLRALGPCRRGKLTVVFGCGGDRDKTKRPKMAEIASRYCDFVYVTSDNPRSEDPRQIAREICEGFPGGFRNYSVVIDRKKAIRQAFLGSREGDIVLLAGKGHERAQIVGRQAFPFSDRQEAEKVLRGH